MWGSQAGLTSWSPSSICITTAGTSKRTWSRWKKTRRREMGESFWKRAAFCRLRSQEFGAADRQAHRQTSHAKRRDSHASGVGGRSVPQQTIPPQGEHRQELVENNAIDTALSEEIMPVPGHCMAGACVGRGEDFEGVRRMRLCWSSSSWR